MKKALRITGKVLTWLLLVFVIFIVIFTIVSVLTVGKEKATIFGYKPYIVASDSMQGEFSAGDIIFSKEVDAATLQEGDIITFYSTSQVNYGEIVTHKIRTVVNDDKGLSFVTYGVATDTDDEARVLSQNVIGKYVFRLPGLGYFYNFLITPAGYITLILLPLAILVALNAVKFVRLFKQYKQEKHDEEAAAEAEKQSMQEELERLRAQVAQMDSAEDGSEDKNE